MMYASKYLEEAVESISRLPGIGKKTALRLALHILKSDESEAFRLSEAITKLRTQTGSCKICKNICDDELCEICKSNSRDRTTVCIVEESKDILAIENTSQYNGLYHVIGGTISPLQGIGPENLNIESLTERVSDNEIKEIILALSPNMEGDTTAHYISKKLVDFNVKISTIARGIPLGGELEYADEITLGRSIVTRTLYNQE